MSWWNKKYGKDSICPISHSRLRAGKNSQGQKYSIFLGCGHGFSRTSLEAYIKNSETPYRCPICRRGFDPKLKFIV